MDWLSGLDSFLFTSLFWTPTQLYVTRAKDVLKRFSLILDGAFFTCLEMIYIDYKKLQFFVFG